MIYTRSYRQKSKDKVSAPYWMVAKQYSTCISKCTDKLNLFSWPVYFNRTYSKTLNRADSITSRPIR